MSRQRKFISIAVGVTFLFMLGLIPVSVFAAQDKGHDAHGEQASPHGSHGDVESGDHKKHPDSEEVSPHGSHGDVKPQAPHEEDSPHGSHGDVDSGGHY